MRNCIIYHENLSPAQEEHLTARETTNQLSFSTWEQEESISVDAAYSVDRWLVSLKFALFYLHKDSEPVKTRSSLSPWALILTAHSLCF